MHWPLENERPNVREYLRKGALDLVINVPKNYQEEELTNDYIIRRQAVDFGIPLITNIQLAQRFVEALGRKKMADLESKAWNQYQPEIANSVFNASLVSSIDPVVILSEKVK